MEFSGSRKNAGKPAFFLFAFLIFALTLKGIRTLGAQVFPSFRSVPRPQVARKSARPSPNSHKTYLLPLWPSSEILALKVCWYRATHQPATLKTSELWLRGLQNPQLLGRIDRFQLAQTEGQRHENIVHHCSHRRKLSWTRSDRHPERYKMP